MARSISAHWDWTAWPQKRRWSAWVLQGFARDVWSMDIQKSHLKTVVGLFPDDDAARQALSKLAELHVPSEAIGVLAVETDDQQRSRVRAC